MHINKFFFLIRALSFPLLLILFLLLHCNTYPGIRVSRKVLYRNYSGGSSLPEGKNLEGFLTGYRQLHQGRKSYPVNWNVLNRLYNNRNFINSCSFSPLALINNRAVEYALGGMFREAEILLKEVLKEEEFYPPALNNLGVIYELSCDPGMAFSMYSKAFEADPGNDYIRWNFLLLCDNSPGWLFNPCMSVHFQR